jgi:Pyruvate:ferredoxin oxidoreductase and related 2-oxoacid:ferredoxin oxidoreductases, beta subunit
MKELETDTPIQWCPGCGNFGILNAVLAVLRELEQEGVSRENIVLVSGIGNHAKIVDYLHVNSFYSIHGRTIPAAEAIKLADPELKVICFAGDGDAYAEGLEHLIFAAKRNIDITAIIHDNRAYALATGQFTPTSPQHYKGTTTPCGAWEKPFNPLELMLASGATFIARGYPVRGLHFQKLIKEAILHKGFSLVDTLQVCVTYNNLYGFYNKNVIELENTDLTSFEEAEQIIRGWDYNSEGPVAIGKFYQVERPGYEDNFSRIASSKSDRDILLAACLEKFI